VEKIEYANKVPSRWISVTFHPRWIEESVENDLNKLTNFHDLIRSFRHGVLQISNENI